MVRNKSRVALGIDPGRKNVGWSLYTSGRRRTGVFRLDGGLPARMNQLHTWVERWAEFLDFVAIEVMKGGRGYLLYDLACCSSIVAQLCEQFEIGYCEIQPSTHYYAVSGIGKPNPKYDKAVDRWLGYTPKTQHERTSTGCVICAIMSIEKQLPDKVKNAVQWYRRPKRK